ncbi:FAD-binding and (Fe-S)-binding domain-containing protein [Rhodococcus sp. NPDC059968]|uniref:FAD-binding and (Fe-S)-binding domain-containing protein n=1 Tax=Rhodococcus sp. NPDC059968 TaxID=3347017 RepID=UPI00366CEEA0
MKTEHLTPVLDTNILGTSIEVSQRPIDRFARAHDASHYLLVPDAVVVPRDVDEIARVFRAAHASRRPITFRSGGTSLSGQGVSKDILIDVRKHFRRIDVGEDGLNVCVQPGATVRQTNARLARHGRKLGPDPASEIACTIGGVIANNSSGMTCGTVENSYRTIESLVIVLPSGTVIDTSDPAAEQTLWDNEPELARGLLDLRSKLLSDPAAVARVRQQFAMKNTMGYGLNSLLDFESPLDILTHLVIGSEGTLAFVAEATFRTVEVLPHAATALLVFDQLSEAVTSLPALVQAGFRAIELMDSQALRVAQSLPGVSAHLDNLIIEHHTALLVELHARTADELASIESAVGPVLESLRLTRPGTFTSDPDKRAALWRVRKGLYTSVAGSRPAGTSALLEDIVVPLDRLLPTCERLVDLLHEHGYEDSVIFGHAKDGNLHFMLNERFDDPASVERYRRFTERLVDLVLEHGGSLKAEHGTGRIMAPFVRRQYGDWLYGMMLEIKRLFDPHAILNPGVVLSDDPESYLRDLKSAPPVEAEVDRCVECGYCEPTCPSKDLTLTPRQRIVLRRDIAAAQRDGHDALVAELTADYTYDAVETCAVDGLCSIACPVDINTGDLVRRLRAEGSSAALNASWSAAARAWGPVTVAGSIALTGAKRATTSVATGITRAGRAVLGAETVPLYDGGLPAGGPARPRATGSVDGADAVFFAACIGSIFGPEDDSIGATEAFIRLVDRAGMKLIIPDRLAGMCCGTPWKSKGHEHGHRTMAAKVLPALFEASDSGRLPIVCDAASCTEGIRALAATAEDPKLQSLRFVDATEFVHDRILDGLSTHNRLSTMAMHHTCSTTAIGVNPAMDAIARFIADEVFVPTEWGCCAFAGDRGLLHPELTHEATAREAAEVSAREFDAYVSANRTCEIGLTRATGRTYRHILEALELATRPHHVSGSSGHGN